VQQAAAEANRNYGEALFYDDLYLLMNILLEVEEVRDGGGVALQL
jgi:hypothetical protein